MILLTDAVALLQNEKVRRQMDNMKLKNTIADSKGDHLNSERKKAIRYNDDLILQIELLIELAKIHEYT